MKLPRRPQAHITDTKAWRVLQHLAPEEWIVREVSERDYGIDAYIEIATKGGDVTGDLMSVQLKGVEKLEWRTSDENTSATSPAVKCSTVNYWLQLPVPTFLFVADLSANNIYWLPVEHEARLKYDKLESQETITFTLHRDFDLASALGPQVLHALYLRERSQTQFSQAVTSLLSYVDSFKEFIDAHRGLDFFMEVDDSTHLQFRALYQTCQWVAIYLHNKCDLRSLLQLYQMDRAEFKDPYTLLHEKTLDTALGALETIYPGLVSGAIELVTRKQEKYWIARDPIFYQLCESIRQRPNPHR